MTRFCLGLDQARRSGWGLAPERGPVLESGVATTHGARKAVIERALGRLGGRVGDLLVVVEGHAHAPFPKARLEGAQWHHRNPTKTAFGLGRALGWWESLLWDVGLPDRLIVTVTPATWRARVLGSRESGTAAVQRAVRWASGHLGRPVPDDGDEASGVCIAAWGALDGFARLDAEKRIKAAARKGARELARQKELFE